MSVLNIALTIAAIILFAGGAATLILAAQDYLRHRDNPPRHLKTTTQPALTVKEAIQK